MTRMICALFPLVLLLASTCPRAEEAWDWPERAENLQVLPADFPRSNLRAVMTGFSRALGVRCSHCHVGEEGQPLASYDFPADDNPNKQRARVMLEMLGDINKRLDALEPSGPERVNMWCHTCHRGLSRPQTLTEALGETYQAEGVEATLARYRELREEYRDRATFSFNETALNSLGYRALEAGAHDDAIALFRLNVEEYPQSGNVYDSLAEAYMKAGKQQRAIVYYRKSLEVDPDNQNAADRLAELGGN